MIYISFSAPKDVFELLISNAKLNRDKGLQQLTQFVAQLTTISSFEHVVEESLSGEGEKWEERHACLVARTILLQSKCADELSNDFVIRARDKALMMLEDPEYRVRIAAG